MDSEKLLSHFENIMHDMKTNDYETYVKLKLKLLEIIGTWENEDKNK